MTDTDAICPMVHHKNIDQPRPTAPGAHICDGHVKQARRALELLPAIFDQLAIVAVASGHATGPRGAETPIPYRAKAADLRYGSSDHTRPAADQRGIREVVVGWARVVAETRQVALPQGDGYDDDVRLACDFLRRHHDWTVGQDFAPDYATELHDLQRKARPILAPTIVRRVDVPVPCPLCEGRLKAVVGAHDDQLDRDDLPPPVVTCDDCGEQVPFSDAQRIAGEQLAAEGRMVKWDDAWLWATAHGHRLEAPTLRKWASRGHVATMKVGSVTLYSLPDLQRRLDPQLVHMSTSDGASLD